MTTRPMLRPAPYDTLCKRFDWDLPGSLNMAHQVCDGLAATDPDRIAIIEVTPERVRPVTYGDLWYRSRQVETALIERGVMRGDRVGVLLSQSPLCAAAHIAAWRLGAISVPLFKLFRADALRARIEDAGLGVVVTDLEGMVQVAGLGVATITRSDLGASAGTRAMVETGPDDAAVLIYTSGTTGTPKGALHGHRVLTGHLPGVEMSHDFLGQDGDVIWTPADWAWIGGLYDVVVPPTALRMMRAAEGRIVGLRSVASGGEPLGAEMLDWGRSAFGVTINEFYGQTECNMIVSSCGASFDAVPGSMGRAVPGHQVAVIGPDGLPCEGEGDIAVRRGSASMMLEYWRKPEDTAAKYRGDWMLTGDRGVQKGDTLTFLGREDDVITSAGYRIGPAEIEDCLLTHPAVATCGVVGKPDALRTEIVKAYVVLKDGINASATDLQSWVKDRLASYSYPREIEFLDELPMTVTGKVIRKDLKARAGKEGQP
ncbi:MAG: AMP-binding protein [Marivita lacus]|nr:AMP-binding protein [Marivita lacus]